MNLSSTKGSDQLSKIMRKAWIPSTKWTHVYLSIVKYAASSCLLNYVGLVINEQGCSPFLLSCTFPLLV